MKWQDEPRTTVQAVRDEKTGTVFLRGTETADKNRANAFGVWRKEKPDPYDPFDYGGRYFEAMYFQQVGVEVEVRYAFSALEDIDDHAEVYVWQIYHWNLIEGDAICRKQEDFGGDYVAEADGLDGPFSMFSPLVGAAVERIQEARWNKEIIPPRIVSEFEE